MLKLHCLAGGSINEKKMKYDGISDNQVSLYVRGVGENNEFWLNTLNGIISKLFRKKVLDTGLNAVFGDIDVPIKLMHEQLSETIESEDDKIYIFGFSRGSATARKYANILNNKGIQTTSGVTIKPKIRFLGCWDTVSSQLGANWFQLIRNKAKRRLPSTKILLEEDGYVADNVENAVHVVSLDDARMWNLYTPTLMGEEKKVEEVWFPGEHGDIGGGYWNRGLNDNSFAYMKNWVTTRLGEDNLEFLESDEVNEEALKSSKEAGKNAKPEDLKILANSAMASHCEASRLDNRVVCVSESSSLAESKKTVKIHVSVLDHLQSFKSKEKYLINPGLKDVKDFVVVGADGEVLEGKADELRKELETYPWDKRMLTK